MCYSVLYNNGMGKLQKNRDVYATFNSLYLVISNILLTHTGAPSLNSYTNI